MGQITKSSADAEGPRDAPQQRYRVHSYARGDSLVSIVRMDNDEY